MSGLKVLEKVTLPNSYWLFSSSLKQMDVNFLKPIIETHLLYNLEYQTLCLHLVNSSKTEVTIDPKERCKQWVQALEMAEVLAYIYEYYLFVPREVQRLKRQRIILRNLLRERGFYFPEAAAFTVEDKGTTRFRSTIFPNWNGGRLTLLRAKRVLNSLVPLLKDVPNYIKFMGYLDAFANPVFAWFSWLFFVPRLVTNLFLFAKHVIPGSWMSENEKDLGWKLRFRAQLERRWFEICNDFVWMTSGLLGCFVLLGPLAPINTMITVSLYVYDVVLASIRAIIELSRLSKLQTEYQERADSLKDKEGESSEAWKDIQNFQKCLHERMVFEIKRMSLAICNTSLLAIGIFLTIPAALAVSPILPVIGACILLGTTVLNEILRRWLESVRPPSEINALDKWADKDDPKYYPKDNENPTAKLTCPHARLFQPELKTVLPIGPDLDEDIPKFSC